MREVISKGVVITYQFSAPQGTLVEYTKTCPTCNKTTTGQVKFLSKTGLDYTAKCPQCETLFKIQISEER